MPSARWVALLICLYFVLVQLAYASATPPFESPDEESHFLYIHNLLEQQRLPVLEDRATVFASGSAQRHHPPLYYLIGALLIAGTDRSDLADFRIPNPAGSQGVVSPLNANLYLHPPSRSDSQSARAIWILRLYSIVLSAGALWCIYRIGDIAFPQRRVGLPAMLLAASIPTFAGIGASINNDSLATLTFAAGLYWNLYLWRKGCISVRDGSILGLILAAAALSKLTGLALFGISFLALFLGAWQGYYSRRDALRAAALMLGWAGLLAGWWYLRNWQLYGDPLAMDATRAIWQRQIYPQSYADLYFEARGVWMSFWMTLGQFNVIGPIWFYDYLNHALLVGLGGLLVAVARWRQARPAILLLLLTVGVVLAALVQATRHINISQGRILFPALGAFLPLLVLGWRAMLGRWLGLFILPFALITLWTPLLYLAPAFPRLQTVAGLPPGAWPVDARSETMSILGYEMLSETVRPGEVMRLRLYVQGTDPNNPLLFVKALDPATHEVVGEVNFFPGMTPSAQLEADKIYAVEAAFRVYGIISPCSPCRLAFIAGWFSQQTQKNVLMQDANGNQFESILGFGPLYFDPTLQVPAPAQPTEMPLGNGVVLRGYSLPAELSPGQTLTLRLDLHYTAPITEAWVLALGLLDTDGRLVQRADVTVLPYPAALWESAQRQNAYYHLPVAATLATGEYQLYIGRYDPESTPQYDAEGEVLAHTLYLLPTRLRIEGTPIDDKTSNAVEEEG